MGDISFRHGRATPPAAAAAVTASAGLLLALTACGADLLLPDDPDAPTRALSVRIERGHGQQGPVAEPLPEPLVVRVVDGAGRPVAGAPVTFTPVGEWAGSVEPATALTDADGRASARWVLGTVAGSYEVRARLELEDAPAPLLFAADAAPAAPATIGRVQGNGQTGVAGYPLPDSLVVRLLDRFGNPVPDVAVTWLVDGGGRVSAAVVGTGPDGTAAVAWTLGTAAVQRVQAVVSGVYGSPLNFTAAVADD